jgi:CubicO group peptidase (beta-lactamase class C family)
MIVRNWQAILDANLYPYDGSTVHELASVAKSVLTTVLGIAIDQGKLHLDDKVVSFFTDRIIANTGEGNELVTVA